MTRNRAAGSGPGGNGITLGGKWADGTGTTENAVLVDGRLHLIGAELLWEYDRTDWLRPWRVTGPGLDVTFTPFHERVARTTCSRWPRRPTSASACSPDGRAPTRAQVTLDGLTGWAEEARNRW